MHTYDYIQDPGHGWIKVPMMDLIVSGVMGKITPYSYYTKTHAYLEEDCDADLLMLYLTCNNIPHEVVEGKFVERSPIRSYDRFAA